MRSNLIALIAEAQAGNLAVQPGAIADALLAADVIKHQWTPVTKEMPGEGTRTHASKDYLCTVLIPLPGGSFRKETKVLSYDSYSKRFNCEGMIVTHWMLSPDPAE